MNSSQTSPNRKTRLAIWTPLPPLKTGIADYVAELLPYLTQRFDLELFVDDTYTVDADLSKRCPVFPYYRYPEREQSGGFDLNIYQMGNNEHHSYIYEQALKTPGLVVLHDLSLSFMLYHHYAGLHNDLATFRREFSFSEGEKALSVFNRLYNGGDNVAVMDFFSDHHMLRRLVGRNYAVLSHLEYCAEVAQKKYGAPHVYSMYLGSPDPTLELPGVSKEEARRQLQLSEESFVIGVFGHLQPNKQNEVALRALARIVARHPQAMLAYVGEMNPALNYDQYIKDQIRKLGLDRNVRLTGFVSREDMQKYYLASDVIVNLRYPSFGQMSATLSRGIATGRPAIITDLPEWRFFPENFCWRVPSGDTDGIQIAEYLDRLIENPTELAQRGKSAREFFLQNGTSEKAADNLQRIISGVLENATEPLELVEQPVESPDRLEIARTAFEEWDSLRAGGKFRYKVERLRKIPVIGSLLFSAYVVLANIANARKIRRSEWALNKVLLDGLTGIEKRNQAVLDEVKNLAAKTKVPEDVIEWLAGQNKKILEEEINKLAGQNAILEERIKKLAHQNKVFEDEAKKLEDEAEKLGEDAKRLEDEVRAEFSPEAVRRWDDPLGGIENYRSMTPIEAADIDPGERYYIAFEKAFRGSEATIRQRQMGVLAEIKSYTSLKPNAAILDVGCGRGEFLALLKGEGVHPIGVDTNHVLIDNLKKNGFDAHARDLFEYLVSIPDGSLDGITAFHVIEHLTHDQNMEFFALANKKLSDGGFIYLETPNPLCMDSLSRFYTDPTHHRPVQPFQLSFQLEYNDFKKVRVLFLEPVKTRGSLSSERWITLYQDYGVLASKVQENRS